MLGNAHVEWSEVNNAFHSKKSNIIIITFWFFSKQFITEYFQQQEILEHIE